MSTVYARPRTSSRAATRPSAVEGEAVARTWKRAARAATSVVGPITTAGSPGPRVEAAEAKAEVARINRARTYSVIINPPEGMSLEALVTRLKEDIEPQLQPLMPEDGAILYAGSVQDLERAVGLLPGDGELHYLLARVYADGLREGEWTFRWPGGERKAVGSFRAGLREGEIDFVILHPALGPWLFPLVLIIGGGVAALGSLIVAIPSLGAFAILRNRGDQLVAEAAFDATDRHNGRADRTAEIRDHRALRHHRCGIRPPFAGIRSVHDEHVRHGGPDRGGSQRRHCLD